MITYGSNYSAQICIEADDHPILVDIRKTHAHRDFAINNNCVVYSKHGVREFRGGLKGSLPSSIISCSQ